jgi:ferredoxin
MFSTKSIGLAIVETLNPQLIYGCIKDKDREGVVHELQAPTDMAEYYGTCKAYELPVEGTCGGNMCASCQCYVLNDAVARNE